MAKLTQEDLLTLFNTVKKEMKPYETGSIVARFDMQGKYDLWSEKSLIDPLGKPRKEIAFAALIVQSNYLGFYYMPIYCNPGIDKMLAPELMKLLKGKACFHIKSMTPELLAQIGDALRIGYEGYKKMGWVN